MQEKDKKVPGGISFNKISIQLFCQKALKSLWDETPQEKAPEDFEQVKEAFIKDQITHIQKGIQL
ncbi:MAG: hypothetical protein LBH96_01755 [Candidatus Peribacteria bacterium]|jgi:hypothetical protein|nr:hypothetical protein [Candidatus Peribacteria bacterium]